MVVLTVPFVKMHGAGNDFVMVDDREGRLPSDDSDFVRRLANRPDGVGCEGVIFVRRSDRLDFAMSFRNPDGSRADLCGNGARCVAAYALEIGAAKSRRMRFETPAGDVSAEVLADGGVTVGMPEPRDLREGFVNSGVPHRIVPVDDLDAVDVAGEGRRIRFSQEFAPCGTNVDFVRWTGPSSLSIRTYERGVEAETFACGTGSVAAALVGVAQHGLAFPVKVRTACGYVLSVDGSWDGVRFSNVTLTGPVKRVFDGAIAIDWPCD